MKKTLLFILLTLTSYVADAQELGNFHRKYKTQNMLMFFQKIHFKSSNIYQKLDSAVNFTLNTADTLVYFVKETYEYDDCGNMVRNVDFRYNSDEHNWENDYKWEILYDTSNNFTAVIITKWDNISKRWKNRYKEKFYYDNLNNKILSVYFKPDTTLQTWINDYREEFKYDSKSNLTEHWYFLWDSISNRWINDYKIVYQYDASDNRIKSDFFKADSNDGNWLKDYKSIFTYNDYNLLITTFHARWDTIKNLWSTDYLADFEYDDLGNRIQNIYSRWDKSGKWLGEFKEEYVFNESSLMTGYYLYGCNALQNDWDKLKRKDFSYPAQVDPNQLVLPLYFYEEEGETDINALASSLTFDWDTLNSVWKNSGKRILYFSDFKGMINTSKSSLSISIRVFPNPASNILHIELNEVVNHYVIELYNTSGNLVLNGIDIQEFKVTDFPKGLYLLKISVKGKNPITQKIIFN